MLLLYALSTQLGPMQKNPALPVLSETISPADSLGFFEAVKLAGLENTRMTVSYAVQRKHFGKIIFGKKTVIVNEIGQIYVTWCNGYDKGSYDCCFYAFNASENIISLIPEINWAKFSKSFA
jgi:hypothetical protein